MTTKNEINKDLNTYNPDYAVSPYDTLQECIELNAFGCYTKEELSSLIEDSPPIDRDLAVDLENCTGITSEFWINSWKNYKTKEVK